MGKTNKKYRRKSIIQQSKSKTKATTDNKSHDKQEKKQKKHQYQQIEVEEDYEDVILLMQQQLQDIGCKLYDVKSDGNCLFRALSDQWYGNEEKHDHMRQGIVDYIESCKDDFAPFMEDNEPFLKYCKRMRQDGTWGGNQELYAAARMLQVYILVHLEATSRVWIECDTMKPKKVLHVAYTGSDHYDSVRHKDDPSSLDELPMPIILDIDGCRPEDIIKRWSRYQLKKEENIEVIDGPSPIVQDITKPIETKEQEEDMDPITKRLKELNLAIESGHKLSKKEQREMKKLAKEVKLKTRGKK